MTLGCRAFFTNFLEEFKSVGEKKWEKIWDKPRDWTARMLGSGPSRKKGDHGLLGRIGEKFGYTIHPEWLKLDQTWYNDLSEKEDRLTIPWKTDVVIEHENDIERFERTLIKLGEINAPLKIGIFYPDEENETYYLDIGTDIISNLSISHSGNTFLIIFGFLDDEKGFSWSGYEIDWKGNTFPLHSLSYERARKSSGTPSS